MGVGFCPQLGGVGPCPAQCIWQGSGFAADQTNAMLAVGGTSYISLISVAAADENSLTPLHRLLPAETALLGFGGSPVGEVIKLPFCIFSELLCGGGITTLGVRFMPLKRWTPAGHGGVFAVFMPPQNSPRAVNIPSAGTHATPAPNRAHSGSHGETRGHLSIGHSVALCCQRNCHRKNSRRKWMHALWRVSAFSGVAAPLGCAVWTLLFPQP